MTLDEFVLEEKARIDAFARWWRENAALDAAMGAWPMEMNPGDWDDQLIYYDADGHDDG